MVNDEKRNAIKIIGREPNVKKEGKVFLIWMHICQVIDRQIMSLFTVQCHYINILFFLTIRAQLYGNNCTMCTLIDRQNVVTDSKYFYFIFSILHLVQLDVEICRFVLLSNERWLQPFFFVRFFFLLPFSVRLLFINMFRFLPLMCAMGSVFLVHFVPSFFLLSSKWQNFDIFFFLLSIL